MIMKTILRKTRSPFAFWTLAFHPPSFYLYLLSPCFFFPSIPSCLPVMCVPAFTQNSARHSAMPHQLWASSCTPDNSVTKHTPTHTDAPAAVCGATGNSCCIRVLFISHHISTVERMMLQRRILGKSNLGFVLLVLPGKHNICYKTFWARNILKMNGQSKQQ